MRNNVRNSIRSLSHRRTFSLPSPPGIPCSGKRTLVHVSSPRTAVPFTLKTFNAVSDEKDDRLVRMLMFGKPGAGKGTLTARLAKKYDILTLSTGDLLRHHIAERTEIGKEAEATIAKGGLVPDEVVLKVVTSKLHALQNKVPCSSYVFQSLRHRPLLLVLALDS